MAWNMSPVRPRLAACFEFRLSALQVIIPGRQGYERDLLKHLGEDVPDQVCACLRQHRRRLLILVNSLHICRNLVESSGTLQVPCGLSVFS